jgi:hypothetical protein
MFVEVGKPPIRRHSPDTTSPRGSSLAPAPQPVRFVPALSAMPRRSNTCFVLSCLNRSCVQYEGTVKEGGRGPTVWDKFAHTPGFSHLSHSPECICLRGGQTVLSLNFRVPCRKDCGRQQGRCSARLLSSVQGELFLLLSYLRTCYHVYVTIWIDL